jgi:hypothetical protein
MLWADYAQKIIRNLVFEFKAMPESSACRFYNSRTRLPFTSYLRQMPFHKLAFG